MNTPLFNWLQKRGCGILLHPTSLPNHYGIGNLGDSAYKFVDFLESAGMGYWQVCPLGPTGYGDSPYQCFSSWALNPYLIDFEQLQDCGLVTPALLNAYTVNDQRRIDYGYIYQQFWKIFKLVYARWLQERKIILPYGNFDSFFQENQSWLKPYTQFQALKSHFGGAWYTWPAEYRDYHTAKNSALLESLGDVVKMHAFAQYIIFGQWQQLKQYANKKNIRIIGDLPIFTALDSSDVWVEPSLFELDESFRPIRVAGVPPDYFSPTGQLWGNPLYRWDVMKKDGYRWWLERIAATKKCVDVIRIDHFRGFESYWAVDVKAEEATVGTWEKGPGVNFFEAIYQKFGKNIELIAEDLGVITPEVIELKALTGLPGMVVLQFGFGDKPTNIHLPHNHIFNQVVYSGTHDNETSLGWYRSLSADIQGHFRNYLGVAGHEASWDMVRACYRSCAALSIVPMQDLLSLGREGRMNTPGTSSNNWVWRYTHNEFERLSVESIYYLKSLSVLYDRVQCE